MKIEKQNTFTIGIAGGTASGKTTLARQISETFQPNNIVNISHDNYYYDLSHLTIEERRLVNYDHPDSLETQLLVDQLRLLKSGLHVELPVYDFFEGVRSKKRIHTIPGPVIIVEGILVFESALLLSMFDLKIFVDADDDIRLMRKIKRDLIERNRSLDFIFAQWLTYTKPMHERFVLPERKLADIVVSGQGESQKSLSEINSKISNFLRGTDNKKIIPS